MNKTCAVLVAVAMIGVTGFALSGSWSADLDLLPSPGLGAMTLELTYTPIPGWDITSTSVFDGGEFTTQGFGVVGTFGPFTVEGSMDFAAADVTLQSVSYMIPDSWSGLGYDLLIQDGLWETTGPSYAGSTLAAALEFGGIEFGLEIEHSANHGITLGAAGMVAEYLFYLDFPTYIIGPDSWTLQPHPVFDPFVVKADGAPYPTYFVTYDRIELVATKVTFEGVNLDGDPVSHVLTGMFEVYYLDAASGTVILTLGADTYLWYYIAEYGAANGWDLDEEITYEIAIADVTASFVFPAYMSYTLTAELDPLAIEIVFVDLCSGIQFSQATISLTGMSLCCGVTYDAKLGFSKLHGFDYLSLSAKNIAQLCCGISLDVSVKFTVDAKTVTVTPKFAGFSEACFDVFGDINWVQPRLTGLTIDGFRIKCMLGDCNYVEFVTAFNPDVFYTSASAPWSDLVYKPTSTVGLVKFFESTCKEFEYIGLGFCGTGCCGAKYDVALRVFFGSGGGLFDVTRLMFDTSIPVMENFALTLAGTMPAAECAGNAKLSLGWTFRF